MENNSFILPQSKIIIKPKKTFFKKKIGSNPDNFYPYLYLDKKGLNKSLIEQKLFKTVFNTRKNSLLNSKNNSSSTKNSKSKNNRFSAHSVHNISSSVKINNKKSNNLFDIDQIEIKEQEDWQIPPTLSKFSNKSNDNTKLKQKKGSYFKTENNQKLIFNNVGIHYHRAKNNNKIDSDKYPSKNNQEINNLKNQIFVLLKKNAILENEKREKDNKIEILEEKLDKLLNFIKEKNLQAKDDEKTKLKKENEELKKELEKKNGIILNLTNNQINNHSSIKKNKSIGKKKEKKEIRKNISKKISLVNNLDEDDINKIKLISIDPDNF